MPLLKNTEDLLGRRLNAVEAKHAPPVLYVEGDAELLQSAPAVSVVGSRKASAAGLAWAQALAERLAARGIVVASGLASGIDTAAHHGALAHGGRSMAVLGTPLSQCTPAANRELQRRMMQDHLVVSQFAEGHRVQPRDFPARNRTMALLSSATIIVEAQDGSGTMHQAWEALRLGRPLFLADHALTMDGITWPKQLESYEVTTLSLDDIDVLVDCLPDPSVSLRGVFAL